MHRLKELRKLLLRPVKNILREQSPPRSDFQNFNLRGRTEHTPDLFKLPRQKPSKHRVNVARSVKVTSLAELLRVARVIAQLGMVQAQLHVARKRNWPALVDLLFDDLAQAHRSLRWRS